MCVWPLKLVTCSMWCALLRHPSSVRIEKTLSFFDGEEKSSKLIFWWIDTYLCNVHVCNCQDRPWVYLILQGFWVWFLMSGKVSLWHILGGNSNRLLLHKSAGSDKEDPTCFGILEILLAFSPYQFCLKPLLLRSSSRRKRGRLNLQSFEARILSLLTFYWRPKQVCVFRASFSLLDLSHHLNRVTNYI